MGLWETVAGTWDMVKNIDEHNRTDHVLVFDDENETITLDNERCEVIEMNDSTNFMKFTCEGDTYEGYYSASGPRITGEWWEPSGDHLDWEAVPAT